MTFTDTKSAGNIIASADWNDFVDFAELISSNAYGHSSNANIHSKTRGNLTASSPLTFNNTRNVIGGAAEVSISQADGSTDGYLSSTDWATFNSKLDSSTISGAFYPSSVGAGLSGNYAGHSSNSTIHFTEASIDHTAIQNIGTNTHAQIDTKITEYNSFSSNSQSKFIHSGLTLNAISAQSISGGLIRTNEIIIPNEFYIKSGTTQLFLISGSGAISYLKGRANTTDDLVIMANSVDSEPNIKLRGTSGIDLTTGDFVYVQSPSEVKWLRLTGDSGGGKIYGGPTTGKDLDLYSNPIDQYPKLNMQGSGHVVISFNPLKNFRLDVTGSRFLTMGREYKKVKWYAGDSGDDGFRLYGSTNELVSIGMSSNADIWLNDNLHTKTISSQTLRTSSYISTQTGLYANFVSANNTNLSTGGGGTGGGAENWDYINDGTGITGLGSNQYRVSGSAGDTSISILGYNIISSQAKDAANWVSASGSRYEDIMDSGVKYTTAYKERGSQVAGDGLTWDAGNTELDVLGYLTISGNAADVKVWYDVSSSKLSALSGSLVAKIKSNLSDLDDVATMDSKADGHVLTWDDTQSKWSSQASVAGGISSWQVFSADNTIDGFQGGSFSISGDQALSISVAGYNTISGNSISGQWAKNWLDASGSQLKDLLDSGTAYSFAYASAQATKPPAYATWGRTSTTVASGSHSHPLSGLSDIPNKQWFSGNRWQGSGLKWNTGGYWEPGGMAGGGAAVDNYTVKIDSAATAGYIGEANSDGVLRTDSTIDYTDGGNFVTLAVNDYIASSSAVAQFPNSSSIISRYHPSGFVISGAEYSWVHNWINQSGSQITSIILSGNEYSTAYDWYVASAQKLSASGALVHSKVTLAGTPNYITISDQEITRNKLDLNDDTNFTEGTGITLATNTVSVTDYIASANALSVFAGTGHTHTGMASTWTWNTPTQSSGIRLAGTGMVSGSLEIYIDDYIASASAISRFADSSNIQSKFLLSGVTYNYISSQNISGGSVTTGELTLNANIISGLIDPIYPSAAANKHYIDTISGNLDTKIDAISDTPTTWGVLTAGTGIDALTNVGVSGAGETVTVLGYNTISSQAKQGYDFSSASDSFDHDLYIASSTAIGRFHPSAQGDFPYISTQSISGVTEYNVKMDCIGDSTLCDLQSWVDNYDSSVVLSGAHVTIGGPTGSINISKSYVAVREGTSEHDLLWRADIEASSNITMGDGAHYIYVDYNNGSPKYAHRTAGNFNGTTQIHFSRIYNDWETGYVPETQIVEGGYRLNDFQAKALKRFSSYGTERQTGVVTTSSQTSGHPSSLQVTAGTLWRALNKFTTTEWDSGKNHDITAVNTTDNWFSVTGCTDEVVRGNHILVQESTGNDGIYIISSTTTPSSAGYKRMYTYQSVTDTTVDGHIHDDVFTYWWRDGSSGWNNASGQIGLDIDYYDDGTGTLNELTAKRYGVHWVYADITGDINILYGQGNYTLAKAEDSSTPGSIPTQLDVTSILAARVIIQKRKTTLTDAEFSYPWTTTYTAGSVDQHNDLGGLQGGTAGEYYHITATDDTNFNTLTDGSDAHTLHIHDSAYYTETELDAGQLDGRYPASSLVNKTYLDNVSSNAIDASNWTSNSGSRYEELLASGNEYSDHLANTSNPHTVVWSDVSAAAIVDLDDNYHPSGLVISGSEYSQAYASAQRVMDLFNHELYSLSSNLYNTSWIDTFSGNIDTRIDALGSFDATLYITSANAISRFADSSNIVSRFVESGGTKWTDLTDGGATTLHSHAGGGISGWYDLDTGTGITAFGGAVAISGTQAETLSVADYIASANALAKFAGSTQYSTDKATYALIANTVASSTALTKYGASSVVALNTTHRLDNTQAHSDYLLNNAVDTTSGYLTAQGGLSGAVFSGGALKLGASTKVTGILDEDAMGSDSATDLATQQSIKKYVDDNSGGDGTTYWSSQTSKSVGSIYYDGGEVMIAPSGTDYGAYRFQVSGDAFLSGAVTFIGELSGLADPTYASGAASKHYVDDGFFPSSLGHSNYLHSANSALHSFSVANYITSANAISRFADSSNVNRDLINTISSNLDTKIDAVSDTPSTWSDMTTSTGLTPITVGVSGSSGTTVEVLGYSTISSNAQWSQNWLSISGSQLTSIIGSGNEYTQAYLHSSNSALHSFNTANYITSTNSISRFSDSSQYSTDKATYALIADTVASSTAYSIFAPSSLTRYGWSSVTDGSTFAHNCGAKPNWVSIAPSGVNPLAYSFKTDATNVTVYHTSPDSETFSWRAII